MRRRLLLADNPGAGSGSRRLVDEVIARLVALGATVQRIASADAAAAQAAMAAAARSGAVDALIAAGGDGSIRLAAKSAIGTGVPVGAIPLGTGNVLAHEAGLPRDAEGIAALLAEGEACTVNAGRANGELFLLMAGAGFDGRIIAGLDQRLKHRVGKLAYVAPTLAALAARPDRLEVEIDGVRHRASWAVIANASRYGGRFLMGPRTRLARPGLSAVLFRGALRRHRIGPLLALALGHLDARASATDGDVTMIPCSAARIASLMPVPTQIDGDPFEATPLAVEDAGPAVRLILPAAGAA
jgi:diacylglycerol kinase family enzyme